MHYFSNKFSKFAKRWGSPPPTSLNLQCWWPEVPWFGKIVFFLADYGEIALQKSYDVISVPLSSLRYRKTTPKQRHNFFPTWALPIKISVSVNEITVLQHYTNCVKIMVCGVAMLYVKTTVCW